MKLKEKAVLVWGLVSGEGIVKIKKENKTVIVPENRPYLLGLKYNLPRLKEQGVPCIYCNDNSLGILFYKRVIEKTYLFYIGEEKEGLRCFSGSWYVFLLNKLHSVPLEIAKGGEIKDRFLDRDAATLGGRNFLMDEESAKYVVQPEEEVINWEELK